MVESLIKFEKGSLVYFELGKKISAGLVLGTAHIADVIKYKSLMSGVDEFVDDQEFYYVFANQKKLIFAECELSLKNIIN